MATPSAAASAYASLARLADLAGAPKGGGDGATGPSFGELVKQAVSTFSQTMHSTDTQAQALIAGKADMIDVVTAIAESEAAVDTLVSVRDKVISAYEDIMKMPI
jgi:flagellar hook-basal body complex protein FliE